MLSSEKYKSAAQGLITLATYGIGMLIGFWVAGKITDYYAVSNTEHYWDKIWLLPAGFAVVVLVIFALLFKKENVEYTE